MTSQSIKWICCSLLLDLHAGLQNQGQQICITEDGKNNSSTVHQQQLLVRSDAIDQDNEQMLVARTIVETPSSSLLGEIDEVHILDLDSAATKARMQYLETMAYRSYILGSPHSDLLLHLTQLNFTRALMENTRILGLTSDKLHDDALSPFNTAGPWEYDLQGCLPPTLQPTLTQRNTLHHPWLDLLPVPQMRDNLIHAGELFDETQLCLDMKGHRNTRTGQTGIIVWKEPWDPAGWEVTEAFARSWGWVIWNCSELFQSTNSWRAKRNERPLFRV